MLTGTKIAFELLINKSFKKEEKVGRKGYPAASPLEVLKPCLKKKM